MRGVLVLVVVIVIGGGRGCDGGGGGGGRWTLLVDVVGCVCGFRWLVVFRSKS